MAEKLEMMAAVTKPLKPQDGIPLAEWLADPAAWNRDAFLKEAGEFMFTVHGAGCTFDRHLLAMLADQLETYVGCCHRINADNLTVIQNGGVTSGANPAIGIRERAAIRITSLLSELGLSPRARATNKALPQGGLEDLLRGPRVV